MIIIQINFFTRFMTFSLFSLKIFFLYLQLLLNKHPKRRFFLFMFSYHHILPIALKIPKDSLVLCLYWNDRMEEWEYHFMAVTKKKMQNYQQLQHPIDFCLLLLNPSHKIPFRVYNDFYKVYMRKISFRDQGNLKSHLHMMNY